MKRTLPFLLMSMLSCVHVTAQVRPGQTVLWRITGNGLTKPSYLFGTMHVNTKEAFYFKDSLYQFMDRADAFAMEIHPDSTGEIFQALNTMDGDAEAGNAPDELPDSTATDTVTDIRVDTVTFSKDSMLLPPANAPKGVRMRPMDSVYASRRSLRLTMSRIMGSLPKKDAEGMDVFMDAFLYRLALSRNKKIFGLEHMRVQIEALRSLTTGLNVKNAEEMLKSWDVDDESPLNKYYYKEDLDSIDYLMNRFFNDAALDKFLYKRNIGMARQMDSIMKKYSLFTAVGTGHLGGPKGVIALLRQKGYTVEPVYSEKKIYAGDVKLADRPANWTMATDTLHYYSIEVPGKLTEQEGAGGRMVRYAMDMAGGITYMIISGKMSAEEKAMGYDSLFLSQVSHMTDYAGGKIISKKGSTIGLLNSKQAILVMKDKSFSRINEVFRGNMFYILFMASMKEATLDNKDARYFLNSFKLQEPRAAVWATLNDPDDGLSVEMPGKPKISITPATEKNGRTVARSLRDNAANVDYFLYTIRPKHGYVYRTESDFFTGYIKSIEESMKDSSVIIRDTVVAGCPARYFLAGPSIGQMLEGMIVKKDNVGYYMMTEYEAAGQGHRDADRFLRSLKLSSFPAMQWKTQSQGKTFSSYMPSSLLRTTDDSDDPQSDQTLGTFAATDTAAARVYSIEVLELDPYDWAPDMKTVYDRWRDKYTDSDTRILISYEPIQQGGLEGRDLIYMDSTEAKHKHMRYFMSGHRAYNLVTTAPTLPFTSIEAANEKRFFDEFKLSKPEPVDWILRNTPARLLNDLRSADSATYEKALGSLDRVSFDSTHIPLLMERSLLRYPVHSEYPFTINYRLFNLADRHYKAGADPVRDKWFRDFIRSHYNDTAAQVRTQQYDWLGLLSQLHEETNLNLIRELITQHFPETDDYYSLFEELESDLPGARSLMPELLKHISDTMSGMRILALAKTMIDSSQMKVTELDPWWPAIDKACRKLIADYKNLTADDQSYDYNLYSVIPLLGDIRNNKGDGLLRAFQQLKVLDLKKEAFVTIFKKYKTVSQPDLTQLLAVDNYTIELYKLLNDSGKTGLLPRGLFDQKKMAKGYLYDVATEDADDEEVTPKFIYIKTIDRLEDGVKKRYYLFRMVLGSGDEDADGGEGESTESYLAVSGPFDTDPKKLLIDPDHMKNGIYWDEAFDGLKLDEHFKKLLEMFRD